MSAALDHVMPRVLDLTRQQKHLVQIGVDGALVVGSFVVALTLGLERLDFFGDPEAWMAVSLLVPITLGLLIWFGVYKPMIRYVSADIVSRIACGLALSSATVYLILKYAGVHFPPSVLGIYALLGVLSLSGLRFALRSAFRRQQSRQKARVIIYGAGEAGRQLLNALQIGQDYAPVALVDDDPRLQGRKIGAVTIHRADDLERLIQTFKVELILLAVPSANRAQRRRILERLDAVPVRVQTVPGMADLVRGAASISQLRDVAVEDLLGREPIAPAEDLMSRNIRGKVVLVTGAAGSIGSEICRQALRQEADTLILFERHEWGLYSIEAELRSMEVGAPRPRIVPVLGSVTDYDHVHSVIRQHKVDTIYHAAAYKHVPLVEDNVAVGVYNNVIGTRVVARAAAEAGVGAFILISTDKAVRPTSIMGASKRVAELVCQSQPSEGSATAFAVVRFGNVLNSSGSVVPRFTEQIRAGGPVTVTDPGITRYFMTIPEAAQLTIQAGAMAGSGAVFVLDMGEPVRILDFAKRMIRLSGLTPRVLSPGAPPDRGAAREGEILVTFSGLRKGEKLYEELFVDGNTLPTRHPRIMKALERTASFDVVEALVADLEKACRENDVALVQQLLRSPGIGYQPTANAQAGAPQEAPRPDAARAAQRRPEGGRADHRPARALPSLEDLDVPALDPGREALA
jgi:FlaA1/EpsC-like NDP-sugar epimerase